MNLIPAITEMENQIEKINMKHAKEINDLHEGLKALRKLNTYCEKCGGEGKYMRPRSCAEDDREREYVQCEECRGTGRIKK